MKKFFVRFGLAFMAMALMAGLLSCESRIRLSNGATIFVNGTKAAVGDTVCLVKVDRHGWFVTDICQDTTVTVLIENEPVTRRYSTGVVK